MGAQRHLVWDWNGTLVDDLSLVVAATNAVFARVGGPQVTVGQYRREFRRPIADYYARVLGRPVGDDEFAYLDGVFHDAYQRAVAGCPLTADAVPALRTWRQWYGSQSLLSMWFHHELVPTIDQYGLTGHFARIDGLRRDPGTAEGAQPRKEPYLVAHLAALELDGARVVLVGDTVDDAHAAAAVGAGCVLYAGGFTDQEQLAATGAPVVDTLLEAVTVAGAR